MCRIFLQEKQKNCRILLLSKNYLFCILLKKKIYPIVAYATDLLARIRYIEIAVYKKGAQKMIEQTFKMSTGNEKVIEKIIQDENIHFNHMILNKYEGLPEHFSNSTVYMTVLRGILSIGLDDQEVHHYEAGSILKIPFNTKMNVINNNEQVLKLIVVKAPAPKI